MASFDFITDEGFRGSLESDYREMASAFNANAWKSVHVLAGSIVEAVLIDGLVAAGHISRDAGLKADLASAIAVAKEKGIVDGRTADLSTVVRSYRNLIHPGRVIRLQEKVDQNSAQVATALVEIVVESVAANRRENYGYTAEQIVAKLERDSTADAILPHLLRSANPIEIERLLLRVLPDSYKRLSAQDFVPSHLKSSMQLCFRTALRAASAELQEAVARRFVQILKDEDDVVIREYGEAFFSGDQLEHLSPEDASLVIEHMLGRLRRDTEGTTLKMLRGVGRYLRVEDADPLVDHLVRLAISADDGRVRQVRQVLSDLMMDTSREFDQNALTRFDFFISRLERTAHEDAAKIVRELKEHFTLPF